MGNITNPLAVLMILIGLLTAAVMSPLLIALGIVIVAIFTA